jgi:predicted  nucleic acid-binding Zn-ribbon protein
MNRNELSNFSSSSQDFSGPALVGELMKKNHENSEMNTRIAILENSVSHMKKDITVMKSDIRLLTTDVHSIKLELGKMESNIAKGFSEVRNDYTTKTSDVRVEVEKIRTELGSSFNKLLMAMVTLSAVVLGIVRLWPTTP